ncbi:MAG: pilus assembly protein N-terminal domain-containing protein [Brucellaceae bacterium]|jgi:Flp pilus assembly secretin CpaC|nr:pilus assembly protein N-terminal domain-containing protein [Brucellaceae bacterium]
MAYKNMINLKNILFLALLSAGILPQQVAATEIQAIQLQTDQAHILRLERPVKSVIIGNDSIADAVMQDAKTIILTGRNNGVTNLVVMDKDGATMLDEKVMVGQNDLATTRVFRRTEMQVLSCTPICEPKVVLPKS